MQQLGRILNLSTFFNANIVPLRFSARNRENPFCALVLLHLPGETHQRPHFSPTQCQELGEPLPCSCSSLSTWGNPPTLSFLSVSVPGTGGTPSVPSFFSVYLGKSTHTLISLRLSARSWESPSHALNAHSSLTT